MNKINFYKYFAIALIGVILLVLILIVISSKRTSPIPNPTPPGPLPGKSYTYSSQQDIDRYAQAQKISDLTEKLPYLGKYFKLEYSFSANHFILTLNKGQEAQGNSEFVTFLQSNQILSRDWLQNLQINVK